MKLQLLTWPGPEVKTRKFLNKTEIWLMVGYTVVSTSRSQIDIEQFSERIILLPTSHQYLQLYIWYILNICKNFMWIILKNICLSNYSTGALDNMNGATFVSSVVTYTPVTELDYGTLLCWATNSIGSQRVPCVYHIIAAGM